MQIDILSSNTLKLTLSRLDMFDLDIKYESLSGKNPETKRLLAHVLKSIRIDQLNQKTGFDFTSDRIFVEAFPRPDGGCMLYVSSLGDEGVPEESGRKRKSNTTAFKATTAKSIAVKRDNTKTLLIFEAGIRELGSVCRFISQQREWERPGFGEFESAVYKSGGDKYRLVIKGEASRQPLLTGIVKEYGEALRGERELMHTKEHFTPMITENAVERLNELL